MARSLNSTTIVPDRPCGQSICACGRSPDPGVRPGGGCYCVDLASCEHGWTQGFAECPDCCEAERKRYRQALVDIAGYENWQGDPKPAVIAARALEDS